MSSRRNVEIMGSLQFKNSFYCSFSRDMWLWPTAITRATFSACWGRADNHIKYGHKVWWRTSRGCSGIEKKQHVFIEIPNTKIFPQREIIYNYFSHFFPGTTGWCQSSILTWGVTSLHLNPHGCWTAWPLHSDLRVPLHLWWSTNTRLKHNYQSCL